MKKKLTITKIVLDVYSVLISPFQVYALINDVKWRARTSLKKRPTDSTILRILRKLRSKNKISYYYDRPTKKYKKVI